MSGRIPTDKFPEGDPVEVHPPDSRAESQAGLNGPSGSPTSPSGRVTVPDVKAAKGLWCDDFDADLRKVVPYATAALGATAGVELRTHSFETNGRINCPCAWWTDYGLTAFFATPEYGRPAPSGYWTDRPLVNCTFEEVVRDEWIHDATVIVNGRWIWTPPVQLMHQLMFDLRGWTVLDDETRRGIQANVILSLAAAAGRLRAALSSPVEPPRG